MPSIGRSFNLRMIKVIGIMGNLWFQISRLNEGYNVEEFLQYSAAAMRHFL